MIATASETSSYLVVRRASVADVPAVAPLFDAYRQFYEQSSDLGLATCFLTQRLENDESVLFLALNVSGVAVGFCQMYPSFCSVIAKPIVVLYDLFVVPTTRQSGAGRALMQAAEAFAVSHLYARLDLTTARTNLTAQALYESEGWNRDDVFLAYSKATQN